MEELLLFVAKRGVRLAIVTVPPSSAQEVVDIVIDFGIAGILNFAPVVVEVPEAVAVHNVNLPIELEILNISPRASVARRDCSRRCIHRGCG
jgi:redox-sensing transcriptional repressor